MNTIYRIILSSLLVLNLILLKGQTSFQSPAVAAPNATVQAQSQDIPVNYYNGSAQINIPITTVSGTGVSESISLSYQSTGIPLNQLGTSVGSGWSLNTGAYVTRAVRGLPDDCWKRREHVYQCSYVNSQNDFEDWKDSFCESSPFCDDDSFKRQPREGFYAYLCEDPDVKYVYTGNIFYENVGRLYHDAGQDSYINSRFINKHPNNLTDHEKRDLSTNRYDLEPDIFYFSAGGYSGKFIIDENNEVKTIPESNVKIEFSYSQTQSAGTLFDGNSHFGFAGETDLLIGSFTEFIITLPNGVKYFIGEEEASYNYTVRNAHELEVGWWDEIDPFGQHRPPFATDRGYNIDGFKGNMEGSINTWRVSEVHNSMGFKVLDYHYEVEVVADHSSFDTEYLQNNDIPESCEYNGDGRSWGVLSPLTISFQKLVSSIDYSQGEEWNSFGPLTFEYTTPREDLFYTTGLENAINSAGYRKGFLLNGIFLDDSDGFIASRHSFIYELAPRVYNIAPTAGYSYNHSVRYNLDKIKYEGMNDPQDITPDITAANPIDFSYDPTPLPPRHSQQKDRFGYYKPNLDMEDYQLWHRRLNEESWMYPNDGKMNDLFGTPYSFFKRNNFNGCQIRRGHYEKEHNPDINGLNANVLTNIKYRDGSFKSFVYGLNDFLEPSYIFRPDYLPIEEICYDHNPVPGNETCVNTEDSYEFTIEEHSKYVDFEFDLGEQYFSGFNFNDECDQGALAVFYFYVEDVIYEYMRAEESMCNENYTYTQKLYKHDGTDYAEIPIVLVDGLIQLDGQGAYAMAWWGDDCDPVTDEVEVGCLSYQAWLMSGITGEIISNNGYYKEFTESTDWTSILLPEGTYEVALTPNQYAADGVSTNGNVKIPEDIQASDFENISGPGLRMEAITSGGVGVSALTSDFQYSDENGISYGRMIEHPVYAKFANCLDECDNLCDDELNTKYGTDSYTQDLNAFGQGSNSFMGYEKVRVVMQDDSYSINYYDLSAYGSMKMGCNESGNGCLTQAYKTRNSVDYSCKLQGFPIQPKPNFDWYRSKIVRTETYDSEDNIRAKSEYSYDLVNNTRVLGVRYSPISYDGESEVATGIYHMNVPDIKLSSVKKTVYDINGTAAVNEQHYEYTAQHHMIKSTESIGFDGLTSKTTNYYVFEDNAESGQSQFHNTFVDRHSIISPWKVDTEVNGMLVSSNKIEFAQFGLFDFIFPKKFYSLKGGEYIEEAVANSYNDYGQVTEYQKNGNQFETIVEYYPDGNLKSSSYGDRISSYDYYDKSKKLQKITHIDGQETNFTSYDGLGRLKQKNARGGRRTMEYDYVVSDSEISVSVTNIALDGSFIADSETQYDGLGRVLSSTKKEYLPSGADLVTSSEYDELGRLFRSTDQFGITEYSYLDNFGSQTESQVIGWPKNVIQKSYFENCGADLCSVTEMIDENGIRTKSYSDSRGQTVEVERTDGNSTTFSTYEFDNYGRLTKSIKDVDKNIFEYNYTWTTGLGWKEKKTIPGTDADYIFQYDLQGRVVESTDPKGYKMFYSYTPYGDLERIDDIDGIHPLERFEYHSSGQGNLGKLHKKWSKILNGLGDVIETLEYDQYGRLTSSTVDDGFETTITTLANYDDRDIAETETITHGSEVVERAYGYDDAGRTESVDFTLNGVTRRLVDFTYNDQGLVTQKSIEEGLQDVDYGYNFRGWLTSINNIGGCILTDEPQFPDDPYVTGGFIKIDYDEDKINQKIGGDLRMTYSIDIEQNENPIYTLSDTSYIHLAGVDSSIYDGSLTYQLQGNLNAETLTEMIVDDLVQVAQNNGWPTTDAQADERKTQVRPPIEEIPGLPDCWDQTGDLFAEKIYYDLHHTKTGAKAQYNGNISHVKWRVAGRDYYSTYGFHTDYKNQLRQALYVEQSLIEDAPNDGWQNEGIYNVDINYHNAGNIASINRKSPLYLNGDVVAIQVLDDLSYTYDVNNQLTNVTELGTPDGFPASGSMSYDANGNMTSHLARGIINISYNHLDLPDLIQFGDGREMEMIYDASGNKLIQITNNGKGTTTRTTYSGGFEYEGVVNSEEITQYNTEVGRVIYDGVDRDYEYFIEDHLGNTRVNFIDKVPDGIISLDPADEEIVQELHYYPFGMKMEGDWYEPPANETPDNYRYNSIEEAPEIDPGISFAQYRMLDQGLGRWLQVDPKAEALLGINPYNSMNNNPISYSDPEGDLPFLAIGIGMAIGAVTNTATQVIANGGFNNWNWGAFAGSVVAGGVGGGVSSALTSAGIGGFAGGAITGGASGFSQNLTSGLINGNLSAGGLAKSTFLGAGIGGTIQGLGAAIDGRRFWDGATVEYVPIAEDAGLSHVMQDGANNCTCATGEMGIQAQGGSYTQKDVRSWMGGDPDLNPLPDVNVVKTIKSKTGLNWDGVQNGSMQGYASKSDYITSSLKSGRSVHMTVPGNGNIAHSVSVKGSYLKHVTKVNGSLRTSVAHRIFDPARSNPFYMSANHVNTNAITIFSMWR